MAETVAPSVRGAQRVVVLSVFVLAGVSTGALAGGLLGALWAASPLPALGPAATLAAAALAAALDVARVRPPAARSQVPQLWGRLFGPSTVAVLYGARLGIGPLTMLPTWLWWAATLVGSSHGAAAGAVAGAAFHLARTATLLAAVAGADRSMPARMAGIQRAERPVRAVVAAAAVALAGALLASCSDGGSAGPAAAPRRPATTAAAIPTTTTTMPPEVAALAPLLLDESLPGFTPAPPGRFGTGPLDLEAAARLERDVDAERAVLQTRGFRGGQARAWTGPGDDTVYVATYQFRDAAGAAAYLEDGRELLLARRVQTFPVEEPAGAFGFTQADDTAAGAFVGHAVAWTQGDRYFLVIVGGDGSRRTPDEARDVARRQAERAAGAAPAR